MRVKNYSTATKPRSGNDPLTSHLRETKLEDYEFLIGVGVSIEEALRRTGLTIDAAERYYLRAGLPFPGRVAPEPPPW